MKYYHGTKSTIKEFNKKGRGKHGEGFYFTPDKNEAKYFAESLMGDGSSNEPKVYTVELSHKILFNTMSIPDCEEVCKKLGTSYKQPSFAGGEKEHYHHLENQLVKKGLIEKGGLNKTLHEMGYDGILYELMEHIIIFNPMMIVIIAEEIL